MGQISAGTVVARFGADTSDFQAGTRRVRENVDSLGGTMDGFKARGAKAFLGLTNGLGELDGMFKGGIDSIGSRLDVLAFHFGHVAEKMKGTAGSAAVAMEAMGKGLMGAALVVGAAVGGWKLGEWISGITGLSKATSELKKPNEELAATIAGNTDRYIELRVQAEMFAVALHTSLPALKDNGAATVENTKSLLAWLDGMTKSNRERIAGMQASAKFVKQLQEEKAAYQELLSEGTKASVQKQVEISHVKEAEGRLKEYNATVVASAIEQDKFSRAWGHTVDAGLQVQAALGKGQAAMQELGVETMKTYGIITRKDAEESLGHLRAELRAVATAGADPQQVFEKMGPDILKIVESAKKMGIDVPPLMDNLADTVKRGAKSAFDDYFLGFKQIPQEIEKSRQATRAGLDKMGDDLKGSISGGFGAGIKDGISAGQQQFDAWRKSIEGSPIKLSLDLADLQRQFAAAAAMPNTSGRV